MKHEIDRKILRLPEVCGIVGLSRPTVYRLIAAGKFPRPARIGIRASGWSAAEVEAWVELKIAEAKS